MARRVVPPRSLDQLGFFFLAEFLSVLAAGLKDTAAGNLLALFQPRHRSAFCSAVFRTLCNLGVAARMTSTYGWLGADRIWSVGPVSTILPRYITIVLWLMTFALARSCVIMRMVRFRVTFRSLRSARIFFLCAASSIVIGSSAIIVWDQSQGPGQCLSSGAVRR